MGDRQLVEVRCPTGPRALLAKMEPDVAHVHNGLLELHCRDCTRKHRKEMADAGLSTKFRVIHLFDFAGQFIESQREQL